MNIKPENTAIVNGVSQSVKDNLNLIDKSNNILDYGAGRLRNSKFLINLGYNVSILDTKYQIERLNEDLSIFDGVYDNENLPKHRFDIIFCTYVLNVIPNIENRVQILNNIHTLMKDKGYAIFEVRKERNILYSNNKVSYLDGYLMGKGKVRTFQKPYNINEFETFLLNNKFNIIKSKSYSDSISIIVRRS